MITIEILRAAGVSDDLIAKVAEIEERERITARREQNRINKRNQRARQQNSADRVSNVMMTSADRADIPSPSSSSPSSSPPIPPLITTPPSSPSSFHSLRSCSLKHVWPANFFEQFWAVYPRKVGKKDAARALEKVRRADEIEFPDLVAAVGRIETKDLQFIPHPATWLNRGSHLDGGAVNPRDTTPQWLKDKIEETRRERAEREKQRAATANGSGTQGTDQQQDLLSPRSALHRN